MFADSGELSLAFFVSYCSLLHNSYLVNPSEIGLATSLDTVVIV